MKTPHPYVLSAAATLFVLILAISCKKTEEAVSPFSITTFSPAQGIAGTVVTIQGEGFSTDRAMNTVKVNGVTATVNAGTTTQLSVNVPTGATTGKITVETGGRTATSTTDFMVIQEPYITSFTPAQAEEGDQVVITGSGFKKGTLVVKFNGIQATTFTALSDSQLSAIVPDGTTTGKISVAANGNTGTSATDLTVVVPLSAKSTVTKLAGIPAYPGSGADGVRMAYAPNLLYITGPAQKTVYRMDLTTLGVAAFQTIAADPVGIAVGNDQVYFGDTDKGYYYTYRFNLLSKSNSGNVQAEPYSLKASLSLPKYNYICANFDNELLGIVNGTAGGNTASSFSISYISGQLKLALPSSQANTQLATNSKSVFAFFNHALWKLQADNTLKIVAGMAGQKGYADGAGSAARFEDGGYARGNTIAVDESDNVYVTDYGSGCIRKVDASGNVTTVVGNKKLFGGAGATKSGRGNRMAFRFDSFDIAIAPEGTLYVIANNDVSSNTLRFAVYKVVFDK